MLNERLHWRFISSATNKLFFSSCLCNCYGQCIVAWILRKLGRQPAVWKIRHLMVDTTTTMVYKCIVDLKFCEISALRLFVCMWSTTFRLYIIIIIMLIWVICNDTWNWIWLQPTLHFFHNGEKASEVVGADLQRIRDTMENLYKWICFL